MSGGFAGKRVSVTRTGFSRSPIRMARTAARKPSKTGLRAAGVVAHQREEQHQRQAEADREVEAWRVGGGPLQHQRRSSESVL